MSPRLHCAVHSVAEWSIVASKDRRDPWAELEVAALVKGPEGTTRKVPAFWAGGREWRVRYSPAVAGEHRFRTECSDPKDELQGQEATLEARLVPSQNPLLSHGGIRVEKGKPRFVHADGTPFFWLGDTWWMLASDRVSWPDGFRTLTADRVAKGFTVVQIVLGFPPDTTPFDGREGNEGGTPWLAGYEQINPRYFDAADARIEWLVRSGIVPCILGSWGYHLLFMGEERMRLHWRYLVARYSAYPVVLCLAGETAMPFYLSKDPAGDTERQSDAWARIAKDVRRWNVFERPISTHPRVKSWADIATPELLDFHMLQPGHMPPALEVGVQLIDAAREKFPDKPVVNAEPPYEGHMGANGPDVQRYAFWSSFLSGAAGFTYGAAGIFQANDRERPTGDRPDGGAFDALFWDDAMCLPGSTQLGLGKARLLALPFERFEPHPEWVSVPIRWGADQYHPPFRTYAAGVPGECVVAYLPRRHYHWDGPEIRGLLPDAYYRAAYMDPSTGKTKDLGRVRADADGVFRGPIFPYLFDWVVVLERA